MKASAAPPFPWQAILAFCFSTLRLPPDAVWALTPLEIAAVLAARRPAVSPPDRGALAALLRAYPDSPPPDGEQTR